MRACKLSKVPWDTLFAFIISCLIVFGLYHGLEWVTPRLFHKRSRHLPHAIVIGVRKSGTRALLKFLRLHPDIEFKSDETNFFDEHELYERGLEFYRNEMPLSYDDQITMEKSPSYFADPRCPERIYNMNSSIRLIVSVRNPVTRIVSDYVDFKTKAKRKNSAVLYPTIDSIVLDQSRNVDRRYYPVFVSTYHLHLSNWLKYFPREQIHIVDGDNLIDKPAEELFKIESFLGIQHHLNADKFYYDETKGYFCVRDFGKGAKKNKCLGGSKGREHPPLNAGVAAKLHRHFQRPNELFFEMTGERFDW